MKFYVVSVAFIALALNALAEEVKDTAPAATAAERISISTKPVSNDHHDKWSLIPAGYGTALATSGAVVAGVVVLLAIAAIASPLFGYKLCQIFSTCDSSAAAASAYASDGYNGYPSSPYSNYQKRSIEYVGPILQALNSAYEKYGHGVNPMSIVKQVNNQ